MDYIQSEIRLIHIDGGSQTTKPTETTANTEPQTQEQINNTRISNTNPKDTNGKISMTGIEGAKRVVGKYSVIRRGIGIGFDAMTYFTEQSFNAQIRTQQLLGNSRGAEKLQNARQVFTTNLGMARTLGIGLGATLFTGNPLIVGMVAISMALGEINAAMNRETQQSYYQENRQRTIQASMYERSRLITNLIGRRR